jgi:ABC-2 type transport system ATP-binding protein
MTTSDFAIEMDGVTKYFGRKKAVDSLTLQIPRGSIYAFLGRNGSGKTTTIRMLLGFLRPTRGSSKVLGHDSMRLTPEVRGRIGYMAETHPLHELMTVEQEERFASGFHDRWDSKLFDSIVDHFGLRRDDDVRSMSRGQRTGLSLALTLAPRPELLIIDDPAIGLDPVARRMLLERLLLSTRDAGQTVLFSSHQLDDVERVADYAAILDYSTLRAAGSLEELTSAIRQYRVTFAPGRLPETLPPIAGLMSTKRFGDTLVLTTCHPEGTEGESWT